MQKVFKFGPSKEQITRWMGYLRKVSVCELAHRRPRLSEIRGLIFDYAPSMISRKRS